VRRSAVWWFHCAFATIEFPTRSPSLSSLGPHFKPVDHLFPILAIGCCARTQQHAVQVIILFFVVSLRSRSLFRWSLVFHGRSGSFNPTVLILEKSTRLWLYEKQWFRAVCDSFHRCAVLHFSAANEATNAKSTRGFTYVLNFSLALVDLRLHFSTIFSASLSSLLKISYFLL